MDYAATTPADSRVLKKVMPYFSEIFANPSSSHRQGLFVREKINKARKDIADILNCEPEEIIFTSGGTESENLAVKGISFANKKNGKHVILSSAEHNAVSSSAEYLKNHGFEVTKIPIDKNCNVNVDTISKSIRDDTVLVSIIRVNNEIGTIQPIEEIGSIIKRINGDRINNGKHPIIFHSDNEAASFYLETNVKKLNVDSTTINSSKIYSIKGAGILYVKNGTEVATQISGGGQEKFLRGGTENIPAIVGVAEALILANKERTKNIEHVLAVKNSLIKNITDKIKDVRLNTPENSVPYIAHFTFNNPKGRDLVKELSDKGVFVSRGAACSSNKSFSSPVLEAMGFNEDEIFSSIRFSIGKNNTISETKFIADSIFDILNA